MDELKARIDVLFLRYCAAFERLDRAALQDIVDQFRDDMKRLIVEHGEAAINAAMDAQPDDTPPSFSLH
jgi:hypothetical protein